MNRTTILVADDMKVNRKILANIFNEQYKILEAADGEEAIQIFEKQKDEIALLFLDLAMPKKTGLDVLEYMQQNKLIEEIPVIMITGEATTASEIQAYEAGVSDIVYKPFEAKIVMRRAQNLIDLFYHKRYMECEIQKQREAIEEKSKEVEESRKILANNNEFLLNALSSVVEFRSHESGNHIERVKYFTSVLLKHLRELYPEYNLSDSQVRMIIQASSLHDIGKIAIPDNILQKPKELDKEEQDIMQKHTIYGCEILEKFKQSDNEFYMYCYDICRYHHERYDGMGYPDGLVGEQIPIWAQIVAVADVFDDLVSARAYRMAYDSETAARMILDGECGIFSKKVLDCFDAARLELYKAIEEDYYVREEY